MLRYAPALTIALLIGPVLFGLAATLAPAFGWLPSLGGMELTFDHFHAFLAYPGVPLPLALSLATGLAATALGLLITFAFVAGWAGTPTFARMQHAISPLLAIPHAAAALGLAFLVAPSGFLMRLISPWLTGLERPPDWLIVGDPWGLTMIAGLVVKEVPFLLLVTLAALPQTQAVSGRRIATSFGYGRIAAFAFVTWPRIYGQIRLAVFAVLAYATSVVDVAVILGPSIPPTLAVRLTQWMADPDIALRFTASAGAVVQLAITGLAILLWIGGEKLASLLSVALRDHGLRMRRDGLARNTALTAMMATAATVFGGLTVLAIWSVAGLWQFPDTFPETLTTRTWARALPSMGDSLATTVTVAIASTALATLLTLGCLERETRTGRTGGNRALWLLYLPLIVPQVSFVFGLQLFFISARFDATWAALVLTHLVFVLPYVFLSLSDPWRAQDPRYGALAAGLGAKPSRVFWRIRLPMMTKPALTAAAVGFAVSVGQYLPTLLVGAGRYETVTTRAVALASGGDRRVLGAYAFAQMVLPFLAFLVATLVPALLHRNRRAMVATA
jgi:putative thiamine transport system permease protein